MKEKPKQEDKQKHFQAKYLEFQMLSEQIKQLQEQMQRFEENIIEARTLKNSIDEFKNIEPGTALYVSLSPGIFAKKVMHSTMTTLPK